jgi:RHS repeat-associated protein
MANLIKRTFDSPQALEKAELNVAASEQPQGHALKVSGKSLAELPPELRATFIESVQAEAGEPFFVKRLLNGYELFNPVQRLRAQLSLGWLRIEPEDKGEEQDGFALRLQSYGYGLTLKQPLERALRTLTNRLERDHGDLVEWYKNGRLGLEQGFTLHQAPAGRKAGIPLMLAIEFEGDITLKLDADAEVLEITLNRTEKRFRYGHLLAHDKQGQQLPVSLMLERGDSIRNPRLLLQIDDQDAVYPLTIDPLIQQAEIPPGDPDPNNMYGFAAAIDGETAVVGGYLTDLTGATDAGAAYVFVRNGLAWTQQAKLTSSEANAYFARSVAIYGDTIVVGAPLADFPGGGGDPGYVYVYLRTGTTWNLQQKLGASDAILGDHLGATVAIYGDTIIAGAGNEETAPMGENGSAYIFVRNGTTWTQQAKLMASDAASNDYFAGFTVDIYGDTAIAGISSKGLYVFVRSGSTWSQQAKLVPSDSISGTNFAWTASLDGDTIIVGANLATVSAMTEAGAAYVFTRSGSTWTQQAKLVASDAAAYSNFGFAVKVLGNTALIGAPYADHSGKTDAGTVYVFRRVGTSWSQTDKIVISNPNDNDKFGYSIGLSGLTAVIGAPPHYTLGRSGTAYIYQLSPAAAENTGAPQNPLSWAGEVQQDAAIALRTGEKVEYVTDLDVNTPVGPMTFTRTYRQNKQSVYQFMGLGWTHNHAISLVKTTGTPNRLTIQMENGGELTLAETAPSSNTYLADSGSDAKVVWNSGTSQYTLTASDKSTYVFDTAGKLLSRNWSNGESWTYTYTSSKLTSIDDGYGRGLRFAYRTSGQFDDGQLWRVGDHQATGLSGSPSGRYVEFTYTTQKSNGSAIGSPKALLNLVRDVLGNTWTHKYYGQVSGQSTAAQLDFLLETVSPQVDTDGNGVVDTAITVEKLTYTTSGSTVTNITRELGNNSLATSYAFQPSGQNLTNETTAGLTNIHRFSNGVYEGTQDAAGNYAAQWLNYQYRPERVIDAKGNATQLNWMADGKLLTKVTDALGNPTTLAYNTSGASVDTLNYSIDPLGRKTQFTYGDTNQPRLPTRLQHYDKDGGSIVRWQEWTYDNKGRVLTEKLFDAGGTTVQRQVDRTYYSSGNGNGLLQSVTLKDLQNPANNQSTSYFYDGIGRAIKVQQSSLLGSCKASFALYDHANHVLASLCNYENSGAEPTSVSAAVALFNEATPDKNKVTTYEYDALGRQIKLTAYAGASYAQIMLMVYDSLGRVTRTIRNYVANAAITNPYVRRADDFRHGADNDRNLVEEMTYNQRSLLRRSVDVAGRVTFYGYDAADRLIRTVASASQTEYPNDYSAGGDPTLARYVQAVALDAPDVDWVTTLEYDAVGNLVKTTDTVGNVTLTAFDALNRPVKTIRNASQPNYDRKVDPLLRDYIVVSAADQDIVQAVEYDAVGQVKRTQDPFGNWTLYSYDALGRPLRRIRNASQPTYNLATDPLLINYVESSASDQDMITRIAYDPAGRTLYDVDALGRRDWTAYDGLWRVVKRIDNAAGIATDGGVNDPRAKQYQAADGLPDYDQVSYMEYDSDGRMVRTRDALGNWTLYGYDDVNRPVKTVRNASKADYAFASDPTLARYKPAVLAGEDQDIVTRVRYDAQSRVAATINPLKRETRFSYDTLGRTLKTIVNFHRGKFDPVRPDRDLTSTTRYAVDGRVLSTVDVRGTETRFGYDRAGRQVSVTQAAKTTLATTSYTCYDKGGRVLRTIQNWKPTATSAAPDARDGQGNWLFAPNTHGSANDQNLITSFVLDRAGRAVSVTNPAGNTVSMTYDKDGQPEASTDALNVVTKYRYDRGRRQVLTVQNFVTNGEDPALWKWSGSAWTKRDGSTAIAFGTDKDQNRITQVEYDKAGRRLALRDPRGNRTTYSYDALDRRTKLTDPRNSVWTTSYTPLRDGTLRLHATNPLSQVTQTDINRMGQMTSLRYLNESPKNTPDVFFSYDRLGNYLSMVEVGGSGTVRRTDMSYDRLSRLSSVAFDTDGNGAVDETVSYAYEAGGQRTKLVLPDGKTVTYAYDKRGRLISLTDWSSQTAQYSYDGASRLASQSANGMDSSYEYDPAGRLALLKHMNGATTLGHFAYSVNARGDRTQAYEILAKVGGGQDAHTLVYTYDGASRLKNATRYPGATTTGTPQRSDSYSYDVASNRLSQAVALNGGAATTTNYTYDAANRLSNVGYVYDDAGRMTSDGTNTYTWDRANRLLSMGSTSYQYNGRGQRVEKTVSSTTTKYTLDLGLSLWETLVETTGANATRYLHTPMGLLAQQRPDASWQWALGDGLGSVRGMVNSSQTPQESRLYTPYGEPSQLSGSAQSAYGFTGEPTDGNNLVYLRGRYYSPGIGQFINLDPLETTNRYGYVGGNPVNRVDPSGFLALADPGGGSGVKKGNPFPTKNTQSASPLAGVAQGTGPRVGTTTPQTSQTAALGPRATTSPAPQTSPSGLGPRAATSPSVSSSSGTGTKASNTIPVKGTSIGKEPSLSSKPANSISATVLPNPGLGLCGTAVIAGVPGVVVCAAGVIVVGLGVAALAANPIDLSGFDLNSLISDILNAPGRFFYNLSESIAASLANNNYAGIEGQLSVATPGTGSASSRATATAAPGSNGISPTATAVPTAPIYESRRSEVSELKGRIETIAEHLAYLTGENIAGWVPKGPNPNRDPDEGWCNTIKRTIETIEGMQLSSRQFDRNFADTGLGGDFLNEIKRGLQIVKENLWCDDYWGDFTGGSFAN